MIEGLKGRMRPLFIIGAGVGAAVLTGCGKGDSLGPSTYDADSSARSTQEIEANYPGAHGIRVSQKPHEPNEMFWELPDGQICSAVASEDLDTGETPERLTTEPYCRHITTTAPVTSESGR